MRITFKKNKTKQKTEGKVNLIEYYNQSDINFGLKLKELRTVFVAHTNAFLNFFYILFN